jgi:hypothetical protein
MTNTPADPNTPAPPARSCGECSACCYVFTIPVLNKPADVWCQHCRPGEGGCMIQATKPPVCSSFECTWLENVDGLGEHWKPSLCGMVLWRAKHPYDPAAAPVIKVIAAGDASGAWWNEPFYGDLVNLTDRYKVFIVDDFTGWHELPVVCPWSAGLQGLFGPPAEPVEGSAATD